jgi:hypothetical protein
MRLKAKDGHPTNVALNKLWEFMRELELDISFGSNTVVSHKGKEWYLCDLDDGTEVVAFPPLCETKLTRYE